MEIIEVEIDKITPDPNQPRTSIDESDLREMAASIITEGIINPIEIDKQNVIVTGERRWRAAKIAGLKTIRAIEISIGQDERFMRQVIENIHHNTMSDWDTANALAKLICLSPGERHPLAPISGPGASKGITWLHQKTGKSQSFIAEKLNILKASAPMKKAIKTGKLSASFLRAISQTPEKFKKDVEKKILANEFSTRDGAKELAHALEREIENPKVTKKLLNIDYSKYKRVNEALHVINEISPRMHQVVEKSYVPSEKISKIVDELKEWIRENPKSKIGQIHAPVVIVNLNFAKQLIEAWFKEEETKLIER